MMPPPLGNSIVLFARRVDRPRIWKLSSPNGTTTEFWAESALTSVETLSQMRPGAITTGRKARLTPNGLYSTDTVPVSPSSDTASTGYSPPASMLAGSPEMASRFGSASVRSRPCVSSSWNVVSVSLLLMPSTPAKVDALRPVAAVARSRVRGPRVCGSRMLDAPSSFRTLFWISATLTLISTCCSEPTVIMLTMFSSSGHEAAGDLLGLRRGAVRAGDAGEHDRVADALGVDALLGQQLADGGLDGGAVRLDHDLELAHQAALGVDQEDVGFAHRAADQVDLARRAHHHVGDLGVADDDVANRAVELDRTGLVERQFELVGIRSRARRQRLDRDLHALHRSHRALRGIELVGVERHVGGGLVDRQGGGGHRVGRHHLARRLHVDRLIRVAERLVSAERDVAHGLRGVDDADHLLDLLRAVGLVGDRTGCRRCSGCCAVGVGWQRAQASERRSAAPTSWSAPAAARPERPRCRGCRPAPA